MIEQKSTYLNENLPLKEINSKVANNNIINRKNALNKTSNNTILRKRIKKKPRYESKGRRWNTRSKSVPNKKNTNIKSERNKMKQSLLKSNLRFFYFHFKFSNKKIKFFL